MRAVALMSFGLLLAAGPVLADDMQVAGTVTNTTARWVGGNDRIVTEATVHTADGDVVVSQLGGHVDGLTMRQFPGPALLRIGMRVAVAAHRATDLSARTHVLVDSVKVLSQPANFVRTGPTLEGKYLYWESGSVFVTIDSDGTKELPGDTEFGLIDESIATWNEGIASCSYLRIVSDGRRSIEVGRDKVNIIKFRDAAWCRPAVKNDPARCYGESAAGITTAVYVDDASSDRDGAIVDMDVELNGKNFAISNSGVTLGSAACMADLKNTLTHELGHLLGLEHPCLAGGDPDRVDGEGNAVPSCGTAIDPKIVEATMYNFQDCGETKKATLSDDDIAGICVTYPTADDPGTDLHVDEAAGCCSAAPRPDPIALLVVALGGIVVLGPRRRTAR